MLWNHCNPAAQRDLFTNTLKYVNKNGQSLKICKNLGSLVIVGDEVQSSRKETRVFITCLYKKPRAFIVKIKIALSKDEVRILIKILVGDLGPS